MTGTTITTLLRPCRLLLLLLLLVGVVLGTTNAKGCHTVTRGKELKQLVHTSAVLVSLQSAVKDSDSDSDDGGNDKNDDDADADSSKDAGYEELCARFKDTPDSRVQDFDIVVVTDSNLKRKVWEERRAAPTWAIGHYLLKWGIWSTKVKAGKAPEYPEYILYPKGSYEQGGLVYHGGGDDGDGDAGQPPADAISQFVSAQLRVPKLGNFVYSLYTYDVIAAQLMATTVAGVESSSSMGWKPWAWVHITGRATRWFVQPNAMPFEQELADTYWKTCLKVLEKGADYPSVQLTRLQRMLQDETSLIGDDQRAQLSQRLHILKRFQDPVEVTDQDFYSLVGRLAMNVLSVVAFVLLIPLLLFAGGDEDDEVFDDEPSKDDLGDEDAASEEQFESQQKEQLEEAVPSTRTTTSLRISKQEKREQAILRAKSSMEEDKARVEQVKAKAKKGSEPVVASPTPVVTATLLNKMTVLELKDMLRARGFKVSGKKSELVERLLQNDS